MESEAFASGWGQRGLSTNRCTPQRAGLCKVTKQIGPADRGANSSEGNGKQRANKWEPAKGVIDRKLTKDDKHDIILKKMYQ